MNLGVELRISNDGNYVRGVLLTALRIEHPNKRKVMFRFLLKHGANYNEVDMDSGRDILTWASYLKRETQVIELLDNYLGDICLYRKDRYGCSSLHYAVRHRLKNAVSKLCAAMVKYNLSVDIVNRDGDTPYLIAKKSNYFDMIAILVNIGNASTWQVNQNQIEARKEIERTKSCCSLVTTSALRGEYGYTGKQVKWPKLRLADAITLKAETRSRNKQPKVTKCNPGRCGSHTNARLPQITETDILGITTNISKSRLNYKGGSSPSILSNPQGSDRTSKEDVSAHLNLLSIEMSASFKRPAKKPESPKPQTPEREHYKSSGQANFKAVLPSINVLIKLKSKVRGLGNRRTSAQK